MQIHCNRYGFDLNCELTVNELMKCLVGKETGAVSVDKLNTKICYQTS